MVKNCAGRATAVHLSRSRTRTWLDRTSTASSMAVEREFWPLISNASGVRSSEPRNVAESGTGVPRSVNLKSIFTLSESPSRTIWKVSSPIAFSNLWRMNLPCSATTAADGDVGVCEGGFWAACGGAWASNGKTKINANTSALKLRMMLFVAKNFIKVVSGSQARISAPWSGCKVRNRGKLRWWLDFVARTAQHVDV